MTSTVRFYCKIREKNPSRRVKKSSVRNNWRKNSLFKTKQNKTKLNNENIDQCTTKVHTLLLDTEDPTLLKDPVCSLKGRTWEELMTGKTEVSVVPFTERMSTLDTGRPSFSGVTGEENFPERVVIRIDVSLNPTSGGRRGGNGDPRDSSEAAVVIDKVTSRRRENFSFPCQRRTLWTPCRETFQGLFRDFGVTGRSQTEGPSPKEDSPTMTTRRPITRFSVDTTDRHRTDTTRPRHHVTEIKGISSETP